MSDLKILVKKKDGSQVRMTMAEFREYKNSLSGVDSKTDTKVDKKKQKVTDNEVKDNNLGLSTENRGEVTKKTVKKEKEKEKENDEALQSKNNLDTEADLNKNLPVVDESNELATTTPVKDAYLDQIKSNIVKHNKEKITDTKKVTSKDDFSSPLEKHDEDKVDISKQSDFDQLPDQKQDLFAQVLKKIKFSISDELAGRLQSLIISRVKEVRNDDQFLFYLTKEKENGGMSLSDAQAQELLQIVKEIWHLQKNKDKETEGREAVIADLKQKKEEKFSIDGTEKRKDYTFNSIGGAKPAIHDIVGVENPKKSKSLDEQLDEIVIEKTIGPVEELKTFDVEDLHRLADNVEGQVKVLENKLKILKKESYSLFLQGIKAFFDSPLYKKYLQTLVDSINSRDGVFVEDFLSEEEIMAMAKMLEKNKL
mgnify:CR=1 FL=1